jgi:hypothetical protein
MSSLPPAPIRRDRLPFQQRGSDGDSRGGEQQQHEGNIKAMMQAPTLVLHDLVRSGWLERAPISSESAAPFPPACPVTPDCTVTAVRRIIEPPLLVPRTKPIHHTIHNTMDDDELPFLPLTLDDDHQHNPSTGKERPSVLKPRRSTVRMHILEETDLVLRPQMPLRISPIKRSRDVYYFETKTRNDLPLLPDHCSCSTDFPVKLKLCYRQRNLFQDHHKEEQNAL